MTSRAATAPKELLGSAGFGRRLSFTAFLWIQEGDGRMRQQGHIKDWKDDKGFGFVEPMAGGERAFVHINAFFNRSRRPVDGDVISYDSMQDFQGRWQARSIRYVDETVAGSRNLPPEASRPSKAAPSSALPVLRILLAVLILVILGLVGHQLYEVRQAKDAAGSRPVGSMQTARRPKWTAMAMALLVKASGATKGSDLEA